MSYLVLARKWRPQTFEDVVGQSHATKTLQNAITAGRVAHGYLFTGPRGTGKTSTARILAKAMNCEKGPTAHPCLQCSVCQEVAGSGSVDVIEIDGASNNGVEDIRNLRESVQYAGARDRYKVYIIDEVHMLTPGAFNALLKTLEEPPAHVIFIMATTEIQKVPPTIVSRTQRFDFRRVGSAELSAQLRKILNAEGIEASDEALQMVARAGGGSVRDSQTLLDQVISFALGGDEKRALRAEDVLQVLGGVPEGQALLALKQALAGESQPALAWLQNQYQRGADLRQVLEVYQQLLRGLMLVKSGAGSDMDLLPETRAILQEMAPSIGLSRLFSAIKACGDSENQLRYSSQTRLVLELLTLKLGPAAPGASLGELADELSALERRLAKSATEAPVAISAPAPAYVVEAPPVAASSPSPAPSTPAPTGPAEEMAGTSGQAFVASKEEKLVVGPATIGEPVPAVEAVEEVAAAPLSGWTIERLRSEWSALMEKVQSTSLNLASSARDAELASFENGTLSLRVVNPFQRKILDDAAEKARLEQALSDLCGQAVKVSVSFVEVAKKRPTTGKPSAEEVESLLKGSPELRKVQELFGAEIIEIRNE